MFRIHQIFRAGPQVLQPFRGIHRHGIIVNAGQHALHIGVYDGGGLVEGEGKQGPLAFIFVLSVNYTVYRCQFANFPHFAHFLCAKLPDKQKMPRQQSDVYKSQAFPRHKNRSYQKVRMRSMQVA